MSWGHGYFTDGSYNHGYYAETSPAFLRWAALLQGVQVPASGFRYLELGCGQGVNLILQAANHPDSEFVGIDFMPAHIAHARHLAAEAGVSNVIFHEADFLVLAKTPEALGEFDYVAAHGITTWVAADVRDAVFTLTERVLKPGGLMFNSYNTYPGWLTMSPYQHLVLQLQQRHGGQQAHRLARDHLMALNGAGSTLFQSIPRLADQLQRLNNLDQVYLMQEYNNLHWQPVYCSQMLALAAEHKLDYLASASLPDNFDTGYSPDVRAQINAEPDLLMRETLRDLALDQSFRRDIYVKGARRVWQRQQHALLLEQRFLATRLVPEPGEGSHFRVNGRALVFKDDRAVCLSILEAFGEAGHSLQQVHEALPAISWPWLIELVTILMQGGWLSLDAQTENHGVRALNRTLGRAVLAGAPYRHIAMSRTQRAVAVSDVDLMLIALLDEGVAVSALGARLAESMRQLHRHFLRDGEPIKKSAHAREYAELCAQRFCAETQPHLVRLGAL